MELKNMKLRELNDLVSNWIDSQIRNGAVFKNVDFDVLVKALNTQLNEPLKIEEKVMEVEQPKKERWFKCLDNDSYDGDNLIVGRLYKHSEVLNSCDGNLVGVVAIEYSDEWQEVTPDFVCQHSGEGFIKNIGTETKYFKAYHIDLGNREAGIRNGNCGGDKNFAYFYTYEDALAWLEKKFSKKEEHSSLKEAEDVFKRHWAKVTNLPYDEHVKSHMMYCIEAIQEALNKDRL
jgi:hypothetical protein